MSTVSHLEPLLIALAIGIELIPVPQGNRKFSVRKGRPTLVLIGDDMESAHGPNAFHRQSLQRAIGAAEGCVIVSSGPERTAYMSAVVLALLGRNSILIETRPDQEIPWIKFLQSVNPTIRMIVSTVRGGTA